jgi:hypothetical protein
MINILKIICKSSDRGVQEEIARQKSHIQSELNTLENEINVLDKHFTYIISFTETGKFTNEELAWRLRHSKFFSYYSVMHLAKNKEAYEILTELMKRYDELQVELQKLYVD